MSHNNYKIFKRYKLPDIYKNLNKDKLPDGILYHPNDYDDSLRRMKIMKQLIERDGCECQYCKEKSEFMALGKDRMNHWHLDLYSIKDNELFLYTIDHIHPRSKGGADHIDNYQILCKDCNQDKGDSTPDDIVKQKTKTQNKYIDGRLNPLTTQITAIITKLKTKKLICVNECDGFTINNEYAIDDVKIVVSNNVVEYTLTSKNNQGNVVDILKDNFLTMRDLNKNN